MTILGCVAVDRGASAVDALIPQHIMHTLLTNQLANTRMETLLPWYRKNLAYKMDGFNFEYSDLRLSI